MPETGGPTAQSGILYQNSVAALYLGRLLDPRPTPNGQRVISVRLEAPEEIDDVVITYENGTRLLIQAKEALTVGTVPWTAFWKALKIQHARYGGTAERYALVVGTLTLDLDLLREICDRSQGKDTTAEWLDALAAAHRNLLEKIKEAGQIDNAEAFTLVQRLTVEFQTRHLIETVGVRDAIPASSVTLENLFTTLRDACGGAARVRASFNAASLVGSLAATHSIVLTGAPGDGLISYLNALEVKYCTLAVPGTSFSGPLHELVKIPLLEMKNTNEPSTFEDESHYQPRSAVGEVVQLSLFPRGTRKHLLIEAGAGFGKSTLLSAMIVSLARERIFIPAYIVADGLASYPGILDYLERFLNTNYRVALDWMTLCRQGRAVLMIDGIDELADEARTAALNSINQITAMFPSVPIMVTARDRSAVALPTTFSRCFIRRLSGGQVDEMLDSYLSRRTELKADVIKKSLRMSKDLHALCSIPLFLALLVATLPRSGQLPNSRADLLERYLSLALAPQRYKTGPQPRASVTSLRYAAEVLALDSLQRHEVAQNENSARRMLGANVGQALADSNIDDLLQCGLLVRRGARIGFAIATVQEYLAGCALTNGEPEIEAWFEQIARRPWVQAVQFALERISNSEPALTAQLDKADDIFHTSLRVIARSVANGAHASDEFRQAIVTRLLTAWVEGGWNIQRDIVGLLADGLAFPPTLEMLSLLVGTGDELSDGLLLLKLGDRDLALQALRVLLSKDDIRSLWGTYWMDVIRMIGSEAVELLIKRSSEPGYIVEEVISFVIYRLRDVENVNWIEVSERKGLSEQVAVASLWGAKRQNSSIGRKMIISLLESLWNDQEQNHSAHPNLWHSFSEGYLNTDWWKEHLASIIVGEANSERKRSAIFEALIDIRYDTISKGVELVSEIQKIINSAERESTLLSAVVCAASFENKFAETVLLERLAKIQNADSYRVWAWAYPYFSETHKVSGLEIIRSQLRGSEQELEVVSDILYKSQFIPGDTRHIAARGPFIRSEINRSSQTIVNDWAAELVATIPKGSEQLMLISRLVEVGGSGAETLIGSLEAFAARGVPGNSDDWTWVFTAMRALDHKNLNISRNSTLALINLFSEFPTSSLLIPLIRKEGRGVLKQICEIFAESEDRTRTEIIYALEKLVHFLGIVVNFDDAGELKIILVD